MTKIIAICIAALLTGCGTINAYTGAAVTAAAQDYEGAKQNKASINDLKLRAWLDSACAIPLGALQRNPAAIRPALEACPISSGAVLP